MPPKIHPLEKGRKKKVETKVKHSDLLITVNSQRTDEKYIAKLEKAYYIFYANAPYYLKPYQTGSDKLWLRKQNHRY